jgi:hypothetical protein
MSLKKYKLKANSFNNTTILEAQYVGHLQIGNVQDQPAPNMVCDFDNSLVKK